MKLSIVIPFHQYKHYLAECLHSLSDSSFHDFEVILVKDQVFENIDDLDITKIGEYLFFEKQVDLIGNKVIVDNKNNELCYKYNPTIPFTVSFWTTRGNYFSTDYYTGLYLPGLKYLNEQYKGINFQIKYGEEKFEDIVFDFISEYTTFVVLVDIIVIFVVYKLKNKFIKVKSPKNNNDN